MKKDTFTIESNIALTKDVFKMTLRGDTSEISAPGQFVNLELEGLYLRRPISVCDLENDLLTLIYKVVGKGTAQMSRLCPNAALDLLTGLGNGYDTAKSGSTPVLVGGGVGVPPLYLLCKRLLAEGAHPIAVLGFNTASEVFFENEFRALNVPVHISTADGTAGVRGFVTDAMRKLDSFDYIFSCGPEPMLKAVYGAFETDGQFSFEERMGCGFGACMGCSCKTKYGNKRICKDGPVLERGEIIW
ncbi:MAG: dihydroorotate dehydrogenase electron transfer subunit [Oscillospiraceae bacterium]